VSLWRQLTRGVRVLLRRDAADGDVANEVAHYLDEAADAFAARGLSPEDARRAARMEVGSATAVREQIRDAGWEDRVATVAADVRYGLRRLRRDASFTIVSVITLALGIGATTAIFSAIHPILLDPLPYPRASRVVSIADQTGDFRPADVTFGTFREVLARSRSFDALAVMRAWQPTIVGGATPERLEGQRVSAAYFRALGVDPIVGRAFDEADDRVNGPHVVVIADGLWRRRFAGDPGIVGRPVALDGASFTVVGVMPPAFENVLAPAAEVWAPLQYDTSLPPDGREWGHHLKMIGRLRGDAGVDRVRTELERIAKTPLPGLPRVPWASLGNGLAVASLQDAVTRDVKPALVAVLGAVLLLLAIACVNVTNLQLARGAERRGEFAMRAALGAGRGRLVQQLVIESVMLALAGGALGLTVADAGVRALLTLVPSELPRAGAIRLDGAVFVFALAVAAAVGLVTGLVPAIYASRSDLVAGLQSAARIGRRHQTARRTLVVSEIGLAIVLLVGAGLLLHSLTRLFAIAPGFAPAHVVAMQVQTAGARLAAPDATHRFFAAALDAVRAVPGVESAGFSSQLPLSGTQDMYGTRFETSPDEQTDAASGAFRYAVTPGYLDAMGIALVRGRAFDAHDVAGGPAVALVSESLARSRFPDGEVLGRRLQVGANNSPWRTVVGVVGGVRQVSLALGAGDAVYMPDVQWEAYTDRAMWLVVRTRGDAGALAPAIRNAVWSVDKDQPIVHVSTMESLVARSAGQRRFALLLFEAFALVALALAAVGIYGVLSGSVTERTREIGVRAALGASRGDILALVARQAMTLTAVGVAVGLAGAAAASRALVTLLFGTSPLDPITYAGVAAVLAVVSALACTIPAVRASRVDPAITLRSE